MKIYIIIGITEILSQKSYDSPFLEEYEKEVVTVFKELQNAKDYIEIRRLKKPKRASYSGTKYFKDGYYEMNIEESYIEDEELQ